MNIAPSIKSLSHANIRIDCDPELIRAIWKAENPDAIYKLYPPSRDIPRCAFRDLKRQAINNAAGFHGVEFLGRHRRTGNTVYYCNAGDTYAPTLIFQGRVMNVGAWGDLVERNTIDRGRQA